MDQVTQNVYQGINDYIQELISECMHAPGVAVMGQEQKEQFIGQLRDHFYQLAFETMVEKMTEEQFSQIENIDPASAEMVEKIQQLAAQIPGLSDDIEAKLRQSVDSIKQNGQLPQ